MDHLFWNKVSAAVIAGALLVMVISTVSESLFHKDAMEKPAYTIEVAKASADAGAAVEEGPSLAELLAGASADKGKRAFAACKSCHTSEKGGAAGTGPNLYNLLGRAIGGNADYPKYSNALASHGGTWTFEMLDAWLTSPKKAIPGNTMSFAGIRKDSKRADLLLYLASLSDEPVALPTIESAAEAAADAATEAATEMAGEGATE